MTWTKPQFSKEKINNAGILLIKSEIEDEHKNALTVTNNWRSSHAFPLNTLQVGLRSKGKEIDPSYLVAQRIKRLPSIIEKLQRFPTMKLSQMQDLGGCRIILSSVSKVYELTTLYKKARFKHKLIHSVDYIKHPRNSGYRGVHLVYSYFSDKNDTYNGLKIEMQIRSVNQHAWATAVETVGTFVKQSLKSSRGEKEWLRFFALMGTAIANLEKTQIVQNTPENKKDLLKELKEHADALTVIDRLETYGKALKNIEKDEENAKYFLLKLEPSNLQITIIGYKSDELPKAEKDYLELESSKESTEIESVLVSVESINTLRRAYPNYFLDTKVFTKLVQKLVYKVK